MCTKNFKQDNLKQVFENFTTFVIHVNVRICIYFQVQELDYKSIQVQFAITKKLSTTTMQISHVC